MSDRPTCAIPVIVVQGKSIVTEALETAHGVPASSISAEIVNHFTLINICRAQRNQKATVTLHYITIQSFG